jgi:molybdopterin molybdotransferase
VNTLLGLPEPEPGFRRGLLEAPVRRNAERDQFVRARTRRERAEVVLEAIAGQESHMIARAGRADALIEVEAGDGELAAGSPVRYLPI